MKNWFTIALCALFLLSGCAPRGTDAGDIQKASLRVTESVWMYERGFSETVGSNSVRVYTDEMQIAGLKTLINEAGYSLTDTEFTYGSGYLLEFFDRDGQSEDSLLILLDGSMCRDGLIYEGENQQDVIGWLAAQK